MTQYKIPFRVIILYAAKASLIENKRRMNIKRILKYREYLLKELTIFMNKNIIFIPYEVELPIEYNIEISEDEIISEIRECSNFISFDRKTLTINKQTTIEDIDKMLGHEVRKDKTVDFLNHFYQDDEALQDMNLTKFHEDTKHLLYLISAMQELFINTKMGGTRETLYKEFQDDLMATLDRLSANPKYIELIYKKAGLVNMDMPNIHDADSGKAIYDELLYAIFTTGPLYLPKLKKIIDDNTYRWIPQEEFGHKENPIAEVLSKFLATDVVQESLRSLLDTDDDIEFEFTPQIPNGEGNTEQAQREYNEVRLLFMYIFIDNASKYLDQYPYFGIIIKRVLFMMDTPETPLLKEEDVQKAYNELGTVNIDAKIPSSIDITSTWYQDIFTSYFEAASTMIQNIFTKEEPSFVQIKLVLIKSYLELLEDQELITYFKEFSDHPMYETYANVVFGDDSIERD